MEQNKLWVAFGTNYIGSGNYVPILIGVFANQDACQKALEKANRLGGYDIQMEECELEKINA